LAHVIALLRRGHYPLATIQAVLDELRTTGSPDRVRAELVHRERDLHCRSLHALRAASALYAYLENLGMAELRMPAAGRPTTLQDQVLRTPG
jgi:hypothetical protein